MSQKFVFSARELPPDLSDKAKFGLWRDIYVSEIANLDIGTSTDAPFRAEFEAWSLGNLLMTRMEGTINKVARTGSHIAADGAEDYCLLINTGSAAMTGAFRHRSASISPGAAALQTFREPLSLAGGESNSWINLIIPHQTLTDAFRNMDDRLALEIDAQSAELDLLKRYCLLLENAPLQSPDLAAHVTETIIDLIGLATGAKGDDADLAGQRGLRAARLQAVLAKVRSSFSDPAISAQGVAQEMGVSTRYVHDLLQESGIGFSERVLELRLQAARMMLSDSRSNRKLISEIALTSGFNDVSYFNRSFRRRFGCTPSAAR